MSNRITIESPLKGFYVRHPSAPNADEAALLAFQELALCTHLNIRGDASDKKFCGGIQDVLGIPLPVKPGFYNFANSPKSSSIDSLYWLGPDEWLLISKRCAKNLETQLRSVFSGNIAIVDVSAGQTILNISGDATAVTTVLKKSSVYDFGAWPPATTNGGRCAQTTFAKASALVACRQNGSFDLVVRGSYADYIAKWLLDAGDEFGCYFKGQREME